MTEIKANIDIIKERKKKYGNNFPLIAKKWSEALGIDIMPNDVAYLMAKMKEARIEWLEDKLKNIYDNRDMIDEYREALLDSKIDYDNYMWIYMNYDKYLDL